MRPLSNFDINLNFWAANPQLTIPRVFQTIYGSDDGGEQSSKIMWAIALVADIDSDYYGMEDEEKLKLVAEDWLEDPDFDWSKYANAVKQYIEITTNTQLPVEIKDEV